MEEKIREINLEDLKKYQHNGFSTVGDLLEYIHGKIASGEITRDSLVLSQRVEDKYFEENNWGVVKKEGDHYNWFKEHNKRIDEGFFDDEEKFPNIKSEHMKKISEEELEDSKDQYHPIWCPVVYKNDNNLYLDLHY